MKKTSNIIGIFLGVFGIILAFYFHYTTQKNKVLTFYSNPESYKVYDKDLVSESNNILLYKNDSMKIEKNVYLSTFSIWNSGNQPIPPKDIRKSLEIKFQGVEDILDLKILKTIDSEISEIEVFKASDSIVNLNWKYFDPGDGIKFQILYTGNSIITSEIGGKILLTSIEEFISNKRTVFTDTMLILGLFIIVSLFIIVLAVLIGKPYFLIKDFVNNNFENIEKEKQALNSKKFLGYTLIAYIIVFPIFIYQFYFTDNILPF